MLLAHQDFDQLKHRRGVLHTLINGTRGVVEIAIQYEVHIMHTVLPSVL